MANEVHFPASVINSYWMNLYRLGQVWSGAAFVPVTVAARAAGAIALVRQGLTLDYLGSIPGGINTEGDLEAIVFTAPAAPVGNEIPWGVAQLSWDGTVGLDPITITGHLDYIHAHLVNWAITDVTATTGNLRVWPMGTAHVNGTGELAIIPLTRADADSPWITGTL